LLATVTGIAAAAHYRLGAAIIAEGLLNLAVAGIVLAWPGVGVASFVLLATIWVIMTGAALVSASVALPLPAGRVLVGAAAMLSVLLGILLIVHPAAGALTLAVWPGAYPIVSGVFMLALAFRLRHETMKGKTT
jgi:uncharacterized membrane protein HdeD (DUF308 family)